MRTKNLLMRKPEGGFCGLAAVLLSFGLAFALFTAGGMVLAGCDSPAGVGNGNDEAVSGEASASGHESAGVDNAHGLLSGAEASDSETVTYHFKFTVSNGGLGLIYTRGIVSDAADSILVKAKSSFSTDYVITIKAPKDTPYFIIRWSGTELIAPGTYLKAKIYNPCDTNIFNCFIDYNGEGKASTRGLSEVSCSSTSGADFEDSWKKASSN